MAFGFGKKKKEIQFPGAFDSREESPSEDPEGMESVRLVSKKEADTVEVSAARIRAMLGRLATPEGPLGIPFIEALSQHPELKTHFAQIPKASLSHAFTGALSFILEHWDHPEILGPYLFRLGARHHLYGVKLEHYAIFQETLLITIAQSDQEGWTDTVRRQWEKWTQTLLDQMQRGIPQPPTSE